MLFHKGRRPGIPTQPEVTHALGLWPINARKKVDVEYCTHLAINWGLGRTEEINQDKNYDCEAGQARKGVDLSYRGDEFRLRKLKVRPYRHVPISSIEGVDVVG
jgi:hypothetical protein